MPESSELFAIETWLAEVRKHVLASAPDMLPILDLCEGEARFGRRYIAADLAQLAKGATVLEVGAGSFLLSCQLVREKFNVVALEPFGDGFSHFERLRKLILERAETLGCVPKMLNESAEDLSITNHFDYAFSINVMEHVIDVEKVIANIGASLRPTATYRFTCQNYFFPYEHHFNIPIFFSKKLTEKIFADKIFRKSALPDPSGIWKSLNWINVRRIRKIVDRLPGLTLVFNRLFLVSTLERISSDKEFALRRSAWMRMLILGLLKFRMHHLAGFVPVSLQPVIDCTLTKRGQRTAQITSGIRAIFSSPLIYSAFQELMGAHNLRSRFVEHFVRPTPGCAVLDIGCGPADILAYLPDVNYCGFDISEAYIRQARNRFGHRGKFYCQELTSSDVEQMPRVHIVLALGLLHHLDDASAIAVLQLGHQALKQGGRLLSFDPCFDSQQNFISRFLVGIDRGQNVRTRAEYESIASTVFGSPRIEVKHRAWIPYTHCFMECTRK